MLAKHEKVLFFQKTQFTFNGKKSPANLSYVCGFEMAVFIKCRNKAIFYTS